MAEQKPMADDRRSSREELPENLEQEFLFIGRRLVMYPDLNSYGRLFGGQLMGWLDEGTAQIAMRIMGTRNIVTKKFGEVVFDHPGRLGDSVELWCRVEHEGTTSLTLDCRVLVRGVPPESGPPRQICHCCVVYVALDDAGRPKPWKK